MSEPGDRSRPFDADVVVVGAGPTGLLLAGELALRGVAVTIVEREPERPPFCRAFNLNARSLELLDRRGIAGRFLREGPTVTSTFFAGLETPLDLSALPTDHAYVLGIPQTRTEELLEAWAIERGAIVRRGWTLESFDQDADGVSLSGAARGRAGLTPWTLRTRYAVGCDGGRSTLRQLAAIAFPGRPSTRFTLLGDVVPDPAAGLTIGLHRTARGSVFVIPRPGYLRVITADPAPADPARRAPSQAEVEAAVTHVLGRPVRFTTVRWLTRFGDAARQAERYRSGRVLLAGDAAHVHPPAGALGLNVGLQDAFNLGWKLAATVTGAGPDALLDSYHDERHAAGHDVLMLTTAQRMLGDPDEDYAPMRFLVRGLAEDPSTRLRLAAMVTGVDTRYRMPAEPGTDHPILGRLFPNVALEDGRRLAECLHDGQAVLVTRAGQAARLDPEGWRGRLVAATMPAETSAFGLADIDAALLRPDGHVAWLRTCRGDTSAPDEALGTWLGRAAPSGDTAGPRPRILGEGVDT